MKAFPLNAEMCHNISSKYKLCHAVLNSHGTVHWSMGEFLQLIFLINTFVAAKTNRNLNTLNIYVGCCICIFYSYQIDPVESESIVSPKP